MLFSITPSARNGFARNSCGRFFLWHNGPALHDLCGNMRHRMPWGVCDGPRAFAHGAERALPKGNGMKRFCKAESAKV